MLYLPVICPLLVEEKTERWGDIGDGGGERGQEEINRRDNMTRGEMRQTRKRGLKKAEDVTEKMENRRKWREQMIIGYSKREMKEKQRRWRDNIRWSDERRWRKYKSDDLIASIVSMEQTRWEDYKAFDFSWLCRQFPPCCLCFVHKTHTYNTHTHCSPGTLWLISGILLPLLCFSHCVTLIFKREVVLYWPLCKSNKKLITVQSPF